MPGKTAYSLKAPKLLPKGSKVTVTGYFDNSAKNKFNPDPRKEVRYGEPTYDEMMIGFLDYATEWPATLKVDPKIYDDYVGKFDLGQGRFATIVCEENKLINIGSTGRRFELVPIGKDTFRLADEEVEISFTRSETGEVLERVLMQDGFTIKHKKVKETASKN